MSHRTENTIIIAAMLLIALAAVCQLHAAAYVDTINGGIHATMQGATSTSNGRPGGVPTPTSSDSQRYLRGDGTWVNPISESLVVTTTGTPFVAWRAFTLVPPVAFTFANPYSGTYTTTTFSGPWIDSGPFTFNGVNSGVTSIELNIGGATGTLFSSVTIPTLTTIRLPNMGYCASMFNGATLPSLTTLSAPNLAMSSGTLLANSTLGVAEISFPSLAITNTLISSGTYANLTSVSCPNLRYSYGNFITMVTATALTTVSAPNLEAIGGQIYYMNTGIANLTTTSFPSLKRATLDQPFPAAKLNQASVDSILTTFANLDGTNGTSYYGTGATLTLSGGTNAAPTFTGTSKTSTTIVTSTPTDSYRVTGTCIPDNFGVYTYTGTLNGQNVYRSEFDRFDLWYNSATSKWTISPTAGTADALSWTSTAIVATYVAGPAVTGTPAVAQHSKATVTMAAAHGFSDGDLVTVTLAVPTTLRGTYAITTTATNTFYYMTATSTNASTQGSFKWTSSTTEGFYQAQKILRRGANVSTN